MPPAPRAMEAPCRMPDETYVPPDDTAPSAAGILHCLRMLAEEAAALRLNATLAALRAAIAACAAEAPPAAPISGPPAGVALH